MKPQPLVLGIVLLALAAPASAQRIKDIATIQGVRSNHLKGFGLVVGLPGTGDGDSLLSRKPLASMLERLGLKVPLEGIQTKNVALVMVTATLPPFRRPGSTIDASVHSFSDASDLTGGTLLPTPLNGPGFRDPTVFAVAQGPLSMGQTRTAARIINGAIVEASPPAVFHSGQEIHVLLDHPDFTVAKEIAKEIDEDQNLFRALYGELPDFDRPAGRLYEEPLAVPLDAGTVRIRLPDPKNVSGAQVLPINPVTFISLIEQVSLSGVDNEATVVINENTGTVVINSFVRVSPVAIVHSDLQLQVGNPLRVAPLGDVDPSNSVTSPLTEIIRGLNDLGVTPKDLIDIVKALDEAGAIQAKVQVID